MPVNFKNRINTAMVSRIGFNTTHPVFFCKTRDKKDVYKRQTGFYLRQKNGRSINHDWFPHARFHATPRKDGWFPVSYTHLKQQPVGVRRIYPAQLGKFFKITFLGSIIQRHPELVVSTQKAFGHVCRIYQS